jgi:hypothetical protein
MVKSGKMINVRMAFKRPSVQFCPPPPEFSKDFVEIWSPSFLFKQAFFAP